MSRGQDRGRLDWLVELAGASALAAATGFAAMTLAPSFGFAPEIALLVGFGAMFVVALASIRAVPAEPRLLALSEFEPQGLPDEITRLLEALSAGESLHDRPQVGSDELLLDTLYLAPAGMTAAADAVAELLLDDPLPAPTPDSRVVQLFADGRMPTAGQLKQRIDRHLADGDRSLSAAGRPPSSDASDALSEALAELRRSLRQA